MPADPSFSDLIRRVRAGDQQAAADLVRRYEPAVRRAVRFRMVDPRLGALFDSMDVCQSVMATFFVRAAGGEYECDDPDQLLHLLVDIARKKLVDQARRQRAARRDVRRTVGGEAAGLDAVAAPGTPSQQLQADELLTQVRARLTAEELRLVELRQQGREWADIAAEVGATAVALRKKLSRAFDRVSRDLGLDV